MEKYILICKSRKIYKPHFRIIMTVNMPLINSNKKSHTISVPMQYQRALNEQIRVTRRMPELLFTYNKEVNENRAKLFIYGFISGQTSSHLSKCASENKHSQTLFI